VSALDEIRVAFWALLASAQIWFAADETVIGYGWLALAFWARVLVWMARK